MKKYAISLFSGMGGDTQGLIDAGYDVVAYCEKCSYIRETHDLNFKGCQLLGDVFEGKNKGNIKKVKNEEFLKYKNYNNQGIDIIFAGFPCQGFSSAGKKKVDDNRNTLFHEFVRATKLIQPKFIIGENVKGLLSRKTKEGEGYIDIITKEFENIGYTIKYEVMKASEYNIPQNRIRLIIVGVRNDIIEKTKKEYIFPSKIINENLNLKKIIEFSMDGAIKVERGDLSDGFEGVCLTQIPKHSIITDLTNEEDQIVENIHPYMRDLVKKKDYYYKDKHYPFRLQFGSRIPVGGQIVDVSKPINTIICTYERQPRFLVMLKNKNGYYLRCLLPKELKQCQGFHKDFKFPDNQTKKQKIIQIGNAVPPPLITLVAKQFELF